MLSAASFSPRVPSKRLRLDGDCVLNKRSLATVAIMVACLLASIIDAASAPAITSLNPASGNVGQSVTINGTGFGTQTGNTVKFNGVTAVVTNWTSTQITATVPNNATTGNVVVTVSGSASSGVLFTVAPRITSLLPSSGGPGQLIVVTGANFGTTQGTGAVAVGGVASAVQSWSSTSITAVVPEAASRARWS
jgi:hypothetical protein